MVRDEDPATFACICATLLPKQLEIEDTPGADTHKSPRSMTVCRIIRTGNLQTGWALECNRQLIRTHPSAAVLGAYLDAILAGVNEYDAISPRRSRNGHYLR